MVASGTSGLAPWAKPLLLVVVLAASVLLAACGGSGTGKSGYGEGEAIEITADVVTVEMINILFAPKAIKVKPGTTVTWVNKDPVVHNVIAIDGTFRSEDEVQPGGTFTFRFDSPGRFRYVCTFHPPNQIGIVIVEGQ